MENPKSRAWKVVKSEYLARKPWFTVRHERIELPDGRSIPDYYVFEYPDWVNVIAITKEGKFVFIDQYRHGLGETNYEIPAGVAEPDDASMLAAAQRELAEETGYGGGEWRELLVVAPNPATQSNLTYCYLATGVERLRSPRRGAGAAWPPSISTPRRISACICSRPPRCANCSRAAASGRR